MTHSTSRRDVLRGAAAAFLATTAVGSGALFAAEEAAGPRLKKAVKYGMIRVEGSIADKFSLIKSLGFQGVEMDSPANFDRNEAVEARDKTGVVVHGIVDSIHWDVRLSDPDEKVREKGLDALKGALKDCKTLGGTTVLLVPGKVSDPQKENYDQVWERSTAEVRKAIPVAADLGVKIAIEVVWNNFITKPEELVKYVDQFNTPTVGAYFDCSNMVKFGVPSADWIRALGKRMLKFDFKGYSKTKGWVDIGEGDENWPDIVKALGEVGYHGWATAETGGGGPDELKRISKKMDEVLELKPA